MGDRPMPVPLASPCFRVMKRPLAADKQADG
jgi:hypothetical protein